MFDQFDRAHLLLGQSRFAEAELVIRKALVDNPDDVWAHAILSLALGGQEKFDESLAAARRAVQLNPTLATAHFAHALALYHLDDHPAAIRAVKEAIRIDPEDADFFGLLAGVHLAEESWTAALRAADQGLEIDASHDDCLNVRAAALTHLERHDEAHQTIKHALFESPENARTHLVTGMSYMHRGVFPKALEHFRETLRIDPTIDQARLGIVECLKARNIVYRQLLQFFLWMSRKGGNFRGWLIIGAFVLFRVLKGVADQSPQLKPFLLPFIIAYVVFVYVSWTGDALFNLLLRLDSDGRMALDRNQIRASNYIGLCVGGTFLFLLLGLTTPFDYCFGVSLFFLSMIIPLSATFNCPAGWPRQLMTCYVVAMIVCAALAASLLVMANIAGEVSGTNTPYRTAGAIAAMLFLSGSILASWAGGIIATASPRRGFLSFWTTKRGLGVIALALFLIGIPLWLIRGDMKADGEWDALREARMRANDPILIHEIEAARPTIPNDVNGALIIQEMTEALAEIQTESAPGVLIFDKSIKIESAYEELETKTLDASRAFIARHQGVISKLLTMQQYDRGRLPHDYSEALKDLFEWRVPGLPAWQTASRLLGLQTIVAAVDGNIILAADSIVSQFRLARALDAEPDLRVQLYRCGIEQNALFGIEFLLRAQLGTEDVLQRLASEVDSRIDAASIKAGMRFERATYVESVALWKAGKLNSRELADIGPPPKTQRVLRELQTMMVDEFDELLAASESAAMLRMLNEELASKDNRVDENEDKRWLASVIPSQSRAIVLNLKRVAALRCARTGLSAEVHRVRSGQLPVNWNDLVPELLRTPMEDPFAELPLQLALGDDGLTVRSVGAEDLESALARPENKNKSNRNQIEMRVIPAAARGIKPTDRQAGER